MGIEGRYLDASWLKANHKMLHYFGLGFIQLKIDDERRMHFYTPELPPIVPEEDVHNHRYDFSSTIVKGEFHQELFNLMDGDTHIIEQESCQEGQHTAGGQPCAIMLASRHSYPIGSRYWLSHTMLHRVQAENCVTFLERSPYAKPLADVVRPKGAFKVCPFSQKIEVEQLWAIVEKMLKE
jgi:hypothetical protein